MITLSCPGCDGDIEFDLAPDEDAAMRPCFEITEIHQPCSCPHTPEVWEELKASAIEAAKDANVDEG